MSLPEGPWQDQLQRHSRVSRSDPLFLALASLSQRVAVVNLQKPGFSPILGAQSAHLISQP